jgi:hypothetical protein
MPQLMDATSIWLILLLILLAFLFFLPNINKV